ncbi:hypothetical protein JCM8097_002324 [Rhodosporidiobolus ruineniae]
MQPYKFPRSGGSLDLTDPSTFPPPPEPEPAPSHPSLLITDSSGHASLPPDAPLSDHQYLAKFQQATQTLLSSDSSNPAHLSAGYPSLPSAPKALFRISEASEYSVSAYSSATRDSTPQQPSTPPRSPSPSPIDPAFPRHVQPASFAFPAPPMPAHLPPTPAPAYPGPATALPGSPKKHHLPSRPLTTPIPALYPQPVPVPIDDFAKPPGQERRVGSPELDRNQAYGGEAMVQLPGRAPVVVARDFAQPQYSAGHGQKESESSSMWATAEDEKGSDAFAAEGPVGGVFFPGDGYDNVSLAASSSNNRFTLDGPAGQMSGGGGGGGWTQEEGGKRGNRRIWWALLVLALIGVGVGVGVGVGGKKAHEASEKNAVGAASDSASSSLSSSASSTSTSSASPLKTVILPSASSSSATRTASAAVETFSTTFGFSRSGATTIVPLTYTIPTSYQVRADGRWQFTEEVVLPAIATGRNGRDTAVGSFTSDLRFRVQPTASGGGAEIETETETSAASSAARATATRAAKRDEVVRRHQGKMRERLIR